MKTAPGSASITIAMARARASPRTPSPYRVTSRSTSWLDSVQVGLASSMEAAASAFSIAPWMLIASNSARTKRKLKPMCSSSGRRYFAKSSLSNTQISPIDTAWG